MADGGKYNWKIKILVSRLPEIEAILAKSKDAKVACWLLDIWCMALKQTPHDIDLRLYVSERTMRNAMPGVPRIRKAICTLQTFRFTVLPTPDAGWRCPDGKIKNVLTMPDWWL
jgi:hypothetical protein